MKIGIIGGGMMGLALAFRLTEKGHTVTVLEQGEQLGGLATYHDFGQFYWDRFYHVILPTDMQLIGFLQDLGLGDQLHWTRTLTGFYVDQQLYSMSSSLEFLRFPPVSLLGKFRLALTILYCARIRNWRRLEKIPVTDWLIRHSGRETYEKIWKPLLQAKLGEAHQRASAVFIWSYIKRMYSARSSAASKEHLGYVEGGYRTVFRHLEEAIDRRGGEIHTNTVVDRIAGRQPAGISIDWENGGGVFDKVISTVPVNILRRVVSPDLIDVQEPQKDVEYLGVVCVVLITRRPLGPYYIVNIADPDIPFTGLIEMSNVAPTDQTGGLHLTYLPKYLVANDPMWQKTDAEVKEAFLKGLRKMLPDLKDPDIESVHVNRAFKVQPLQVLGFSEIVPRVRTKHRDFFVLNTSQFVVGTLNNNEVIKAVNGFLSEYGSAFDEQAAEQAVIGERPPGEAHEV